MNKQKLDGILFCLMGVIPFLTWFLLGGITFQAGREELPRSGCIVEVIYHYTTFSTLLKENFGLNELQQFTAFGVLLVIFVSYGIWTMKYKHS